MQENSSDWDQWLAAGRDTVVLVDHDGEARHYRRYLASRQGGNAWLETVRVLPRAQWLVELWDSSFPARQVLRPAQLLALAENIVVNSPFLAETVINPLGIARSFVEAFELAERHALTVAPDSGAGDELRAFAEWRDTLRRQLRDQQALSAAQLPAVLAEALAGGELELPERLVLSAALELSAPEAALIEQCRLQGTDTLKLPPFATELDSEPELQQWRGENLAAEVDAAAAWAAEALEKAGSRARDKSSTTPRIAPRITIAAPNITAYEEPLRRALERRVYPYTLFPAGADAELIEPWRIGTGRLAGYPVIATAADILALPAGVKEREVELEQLSRVLRSPFVADAERLRSERALQDLDWREALPGRVSASTALRRAARRDGNAEATAFLRELLDAARDQRKAALPSVWVRRFDRELAACGWPNRAPGDPVVDQCLEGFGQVMDTLRALDRQLGAVDRATALRWLQHLLTEKRFELQRDEAPPIQLLSLDEALGQQFDALWLLGASDRALPRPLAPSPFLPREVLRSAGVPRADAGDALGRDREALAALLRAAPAIVVSCPDQDAEGVEQGACTLLDWSWPARSTTRRAGFAIDADVRVPTEETIRPVSAAERQSLRGGTGLFKAFAASPFLAFLKYRLGLRRFPEPVEGLDPATQGGWIHRALELFWRETRDSESLQALSPEARRTRLSICVEQAMRGSALYGDELLRIEQRRIEGLLEAWLAFEAERGEPFAVESVERGGAVDAWGIPLSIQLDRVDRIGEHRLLIDYKTGTIQANWLNAESLQEPQLPLYALLASHFTGAVDGIAIVQIHPRDGMSVHMRSNWAASLVPKTVRNPVDTPEKWQSELAAWEKVLRAYATGFLSGDIAHDFSQDASAFRFDPYVTTLARVEDYGDE